MASSGNTWCKKLLQKKKVHALKAVLGNERGLLARSGGDRYVKVPIHNDKRAVLAKYKFGVADGDMPDKPLPKPVPTMEQVKSGEVELRPFIAPMVSGFKARRFGKRIGERQTPRGFNAAL